MPRERARCYFRSIARPSVTLALSLTLALSCAGVAATAQTLTLRYANDYFTATDRYFTQGIYLGVDYERVGFLVAQEGFTPTDLSDPDVRPRDRPYAGTLYLGARARRGPWSYDAIAGVIGPAALGEEQQTGIHRAIEDELPMGWRHQIQNGLLLDIGVGFRQNLLGADHFAVDAEAGARLGSFKTRISAGTELRAGWPQLAGFASARALTPLHDASLRGNVLGAGSPHTFAFAEVSHLVGRLDIGVRGRLGRFVLAYARSFATPEFDDADAHGWGTLSLTLLSRHAPRASLVEEAWGTGFRRW